MNWKEKKVKSGAAGRRQGKNRRLLLLAGAAIALAAIRLPAITVLSPNGGESWGIGNRVSISWTATAAVENVRILLYRGGTREINRVGFIAASVPGAAASYSWTAGEYSGGRADAGDDYCGRVRIIGADEEDFSDSAFSLQLATITVSEPMETAAYEASTGTMRVAWTSTGVSGNVRIDLERQDGAERYVISDSVIVTGSPVNWPIPLATVEGTYRVRVSQGAISGSSGRCHIMAYSPPGLAVLQPNGGEELVMGRSYPVRWLPHHLSGNVRVELLKDGRLVGVLSDSSPVGGMCTYYWDAKTCGTVKLLARSGYKVRVSTLDGLHSDVSDGSFSLTLPPNIILFDPNRGDTWVSGTVEEIRWNATKLDGYMVEIDLNFPDPGRPTGIGGFIIARAVPGTDRHFAWTVGTVLNAGRVYFNRGLKRDCTIKLRATKGTSVLLSESRPFNINTLE
jgi:hypothetical protein